MAGARFPDVLKSLLAGARLTRGQAKTAMGEVLSDRATPAQLGAFLAALKLRGESEEELVGFAQAVRERALRVRVKREPLIDTCGTGGDGAGTFNISTTVAFIAAGAGAAVAKHGNRAVSSRCGSADVLEALGVPSEVSPALAARCIEEAGIGFLFAPSLHPRLRAAGQVRRELKVRTVFNLLGPLANPARAPRQLMGVYATALVEPIARALGALGSVEAIVVSSQDGLDEISLGAATFAARLKDGKVRAFEIRPERLGLKTASPRALAGGSAKTNARILLSVLKGERGARRDVCLLNAGAALLAAGLARDLREGLERASESIDSGRALDALETLKRMTNGRGR